MLALENSGFLSVTSVQDDQTWNDHVSSPDARVVHER